MRSLLRLAKQALVWARRHVNEVEDAAGKVIVIIAVVLICLRIIMPVRHLPDGYVIYFYPWQDFTPCETSVDCNIDRSRTATESGTVALLTVGLLYTRHQRRQ